VRKRGSILRILNFIILYFVFFYITYYLLTGRQIFRRPDSYKLPEVPKAATVITSDEKNNIEIYRKTAPGVVNITSTALALDFFYNIIPMSGSGSGFIFDKDKGLILTNYHVVKNAKYLEVTLNNGRKIKANFVGADPYHDIAVIALTVIPDEIVALPLGDSENLKIGQKVLAIGNPFGLQGTLTTGIISSLNRSIKTREGNVIDELIQTDAAINPGNSGGPLLDSSGRVIGINTAIFSTSGGNIGIGFALPIHKVKSLIPDLVTLGHSRKPYLGVKIQSLIPEFAKVMGVNVKRGAIIVEVVEGSPASEAGLQGASKMLQIGNMLVGIDGDIVIGVDDKKVNNKEDLVKFISKKAPGNKIKLTIIRNNKKMNIEVKLGAMSE